MGGGRTAKKKSKAARRTSAAASRVAKAQQLELQPEPEPEATDGLAALPLPRTMVACRGSATAAGEPPLRVVTYNILAQTYFASNPRQQATCPPGSRGQKARHATLMHELDSMIGDVGNAVGSGTAVICLQEVEGTYLDSLLRPALVSRGYQVLFLRKNDGPGGAQKVEGVAIAWRGDVELVEHQEIDLDQRLLDAAAAAAPAADDSGGGGEGRGQQLASGGGSGSLAWANLSKTHHDARSTALPHKPGSVALLVRLRSTAGAGAGAGAAVSSQRSAGAELAIGTIHVYWDYRRHDLQTLQARITADALFAMASGGGGGLGCPALLCGDFNAQPQSTLYTLLQQGVLSVRSSACAASLQTCSSSSSSSSSTTTSS